MNAAVSSSGGLGLPRLWVRVPLPPSPPGPFPRSPAGAALCAAHRRFQTLHRGNDRHTESLFAKLGMDSKRPQRKGGPTYCDRALHCTETELQQAFLEQASKLRDPLNDPADKAKLKELQDALRQLMDPQFRARYSSHHVCSNDAQLHVLQDGGQVSANFNPEHQQFSYVDHSQPPAGGWSGLPPVQDATGRKASPAADDPTAYSLGFGASATAPCRGEDIHLQLRLSFQEGWAGGAQEVLYAKETTCDKCRGLGTSAPRQPTSTRRARRCPQCHGRGSVVLPSATYQITQPCGYCAGEGTEPPLPCAACHGRGVTAARAADAPLRIAVPAQTTAPLSTFRLKGRGHDGRRGGPPGDVVLTVLVAEHRYFHFDPLHRALHVVLPISLTTALLGGVLQVPHLHRQQTKTEADARERDNRDSAPPSFSVRVPPGVSNGHQLRLPLPNGGDGAQEVTVVVHLLVSVPRGYGLTGRQKAALRLYEGEMPDFCSTAHAEEVPGPAADLTAAERCGCSAELMTVCAHLKSRYRHWLSVP